MEALAPGDPQRIGGYRLLGRLGAGGMGRVYLARSEGGRTVAVKVVHEEHAADDQFRARFRREIKAARKVGEHHTAPVLDADPDAERPWVATGFVPGPSLEQVVRQHGPLPPATLHALADGLLRALRGIHAAGILHRDLKPSNVLLTVEGPKVIDFGIARAMQPSAESLVTSTGMVVGSPGFMAPEQVRGKPLGPEADVFALGCVLMYAATARLPFGHGAGNQHAVMYGIVEDEPELHRVQDDRLRAFLARCLEKDPAERPGVEALLAEECLSGAPAPDGGAWLPPELVASLARQAARLLDAEALTAREPEAPERPEQPETSPAPADQGTLGLRPNPTPGEQPPADRTAPGRSRRRWVVLPVVAAVLGIGVTVPFVLPDGKDHARQAAPGRDGGAASPPLTPTPPSQASAGPEPSPSGSETAGESAPSPGADASSPDSKAKDDGTTGTASGGSGPTRAGGGTPPDSDANSGSGSGSGSGSSSGSGSGSGTNPDTAPAPAPAPNPSSTPAPAPDNKVPSAFVGTWTYSGQFNINQPQTVTLYRAAPGQIAAKLITDVNGAHCEHVAKLISVTDKGRRINLGPGTVDRARSASYCADQDPSYFALATPTGIRHDVGPAHGDGYHYKRAS